MSSTSVLRACVSPSVQSVVCDKESFHGQQLTYIGRQRARCTSCVLTTPSTPISWTECAKGDTYQKVHTSEARSGRVRYFSTHPGQWPTFYELQLNGGAERRISPSGGAQLGPDGRLDGNPQAVLNIDDLPAGEKQIELWMPHTAIVTIESLEIDPGAEWAPWPDERFRIVCHGSSITHGVGADAATEAWPTVVGRLAGAQVLNLGWAGSCLISGLASRAVRDQPADLTVLELGINVYGGGLLKERTFTSSVHSMISIVREKHANTPIVVVSPIYASSRETVAEGDGLTVVQMRTLLEQVVLQRAPADRNLRYLSGLELFGPGDAADLPDGLHPNAAGYLRIGERFYAAARRFLSR